MRYFVVVPAFNEEKTLKRVLLSLKEVTSNIIVVDDGSTDKTNEIARQENVIVPTHIINRGLGAALGTGIELALDMGAEAIVTFDADGQHEAKDIERMIEPIQRGDADAVIGSRLLSNEHYMPVIRRVYNIVGNVITYILFGMKVSDSQSGLRAFGKHAAKSLKLRSNRMEVSSEFIHEIKLRNLRLKEIPIKAIYSDYSLSKGQSFFVGIKTLIKLIVIKIIK